MNKILKTFMFIMIFHLSHLHAASTVGTRSGEFLRLGAGARAEAMGQAFCAISDDGSAIYWNPAGLSRVREQTLLLMHAPYIESSFFDFGSYSLPIGRRTTLGLGVQYHSEGSLVKRDLSGTEVGSFTPTDTAFSLGGAADLSVLSVGGTVKLINSKLADSASTVSFDAGLLSPWYFDKLSLGVSASNIGGKLKYELKEEKLPTSFRLGLAIKPFNNFLFSADYSLPSSQDSFFSAGSEYVMKFRSSTSISFRVGYSGRSDVSGVSTITGGMGFRYRKLSLDYALAPMGDLGLTHRISTSINF